MWGNCTCDDFPYWSLCLRMRCGVDALVWMPLPCWFVVLWGWFFGGYKWGGGEGRGGLSHLPELSLLLYYSIPYCRVIYPITVLYTLLLYYIPYCSTIYPIALLYTLLLYYIPYCSTIYPIAVFHNILILQGIEKGISDEIHYLSQVSTSQAHQGSVYGPEKVTEILVISIIEPLCVPTP